MRRFIAAVLVLTGLGVVGYVALDDHGADVGEVSIAADDQSAATETASDAPAEPSEPATTAAAPSSDAPSAAPPATATPAPAAAPTIGRSSARIGDVDLSPPPAPSTVALPSIGVDARTVVPVGKDPDGKMTVPEDIQTIGWFRLSASPADDEGTIVLSGHVDSRTQGRGAFFDLRVVEVGDEVSITDEDGTSTTWRVTGRRTYEKDSLPVSDLWRSDGPLRLVLITCGGDFDADRRSYESNVVVEAEPVQ